jgi:predicted phage terminase large subunit-like protein
MQSDLERELAIEKEMWRREQRTSFRAFCVEAMSQRGFVPARHHLFLIDELIKVADGITDRLMVFMPPGHAKTLYGSILFPAWLLAQNVGTDIIAASYNSDYAEDTSGKLIRMIREHERVLEYKLLNDSRGFWETDRRGQYRASGVGGGITGRRADLVLIDDPFKGRKEANSETERNTLWNWYRAEIITRLKPGARIVLIQTCWHHDDLAGRLLAQPNADQWRIVNLPALAEENDMLGRQPGEALWPEWEDEEKLARKREEVGEFEWSALYQQRPTPIEGSLFKPGMMPIPDAAPQCVSVVRSWDLAGTEKNRGNNPDWTVGLKVGRTPTGSYVVLDEVRFRGGPDAVDATILNTAHLDGKSVKIRLPEDAGQAGKNQTLHLTRMLAGFTVTFERETGGKDTRAMPVASQVNVGNVAMVKADWNMPFRDELAAFPAGTFDDRVDALSGAFVVIGLARPPMQISTAALERMMMR